MPQTRHHYRTCRDQDCPRLACQAWKEAYAEGYADGRQSGYEDGFIDGQASCPREHK
jgi:hypothetical protein